MFDHRAAGPSNRPQVGSGRVGNGPCESLWRYGWAAGGGKVHVQGTVPAPGLVALPGRPARNESIRPRGCAVRFLGVNPLDPPASLQAADTMAALALIQAVRAPPSSCGHHGAGFVCRGCGLGFSSWFRWFGLNTAAAAALGRPAEAVRLFHARPKLPFASSKSRISPRFFNSPRSPARPVAARGPAAWARPGLRRPRTPRSTSGKQRRAGRCR